MPRKSKPTKVLLAFAEYVDENKESDKTVSDFLEVQWETFKATLPEPKKRDPVDPTTQILKIIEKKGEDLDIDAIESELSSLKKPTKRRKTE